MALEEPVKRLQSYQPPTYIAGIGEAFNRARVDALIGWNREYAPRKEYRPIGTAVGLPGRLYNPPGRAFPGAGPPAVGVPARPGNTGPLRGEDPGNEWVDVEGSTVINPETLPKATVFESETPWWVDIFGSIFGESTTEGPSMAVDWGDIFGTALGGIASGISGPGTTTFFPPSPGPMVGAPGPVVATMQAGACGPQKGCRSYTYDSVTGEYKPCRRRRRRRLLTSSDLADLASLKAIIGGGGALNAAVVKAVRR